jgi:hypothetical protein
MNSAASDPINVFWDSCIFIRYITETPKDRLQDIHDFLADAQGKGTKRRNIYYSTIVYSEIRPRYFKDSKYGSLEEFFASFGSSFNPIDPNPNILIGAGELRDAVPIDPSNGNASNRSIGTPDAIHLITCLYLRDVLGVSDIIFHSFDTGRGKTWEGKCVPIVGFEKWFPESSRTPRVMDVCALQRCEPLHPQPRLSLVSGRAIDA